ncbi:uncharacterized protein At1g01500-like [Zingiber officinale]|uniref:Erythronate-4-phosphate dehydrogenase family protein n=1 Tax=Zingiber officinale TaxID=94328 RepID=A0A8J5KUN6_ZINOF|nr:uncharacterized protein At1g01500-like [Zingiber officinale]KAG6493895.1 hypothetical protein ZIOFF_048898 [Zingiber officinale]
MGTASHKLPKFLRNEDNRNIIIHPLYLPKSSPWLDLKVFYVRLSNYEVGESTPEHLTIKHTSLTPDTILEINGRRSGIYSDCVSCFLRRDRMDKKSEEATFVGTDCIRMTGSVRFDVWDGDDMLLSGVLELGDSNGLKAETKISKRKWRIKCRIVSTAAFRFLDDKIKSSESSAVAPLIEVYIAGCSSGSPIIFTKTMRLPGRMKCQKKLMHDSILDTNSMDTTKDLPLKDVSQETQYGDDKSENSTDMDYENLQPSADYVDEDGELSWFNEGVKVGVGISISVCIGIGIGVGLLIRTYRATSRDLKRKYF